MQANYKITVSSRLASGWHRLEADYPIHLRGGETGFAFHLSWTLFRPHSRSFAILGSKFAPFLTDQQHHVSFESPLASILKNPWS